MEARYVTNIRSFSTAPRKLACICQILVLLSCSKAVGDIEFDFVPIAATDGLGNPVAILPGNTVYPFGGGTLTYVLRVEIPDDPSGMLLGGTFFAAHDSYAGLEILSHECLMTTGAFCDDGFLLNSPPRLWFNIPSSSSPLVQVGTIEYANPSNSTILPEADLTWMANGTTHNAVVQSEETRLLHRITSGSVVQINLTSQLVAPMLPDLTVPASGTGATSLANPASSFIVGFDAPQTGQIRVAMKLEGVDVYSFYSDLAHAASLWGGEFTRVVDPDLAAMGDFNLMYTFSHGYVDQLQMAFEDYGVPLADVHEIAVSSLSPPSFIRGDFNNDQLWNVDDLDALILAIISGTYDAGFDLNGDGLLSENDIHDPTVGWLAVGGAQNPDLTSGNAFLPGDANLDGAVDGADFLVWNQHKFNDFSALHFEWSKGSFNLDPYVDGQDFIIWNANKFSSSSNEPVPEPSALILLLMPALWLLVNRTRR